METQRTELRESRIHFELHRHLQNAIEKGISLHKIRFARSEPEYSQNLVRGQRADLVVFDDKDRPWIVIEAKRKQAGDTFTRDFDPYSPKVREQALKYAQQLGSPFFATYNGDVLVLFKTYEEFRPLLQRVSKSYKVTDVATFAEELLRDIILLHQQKTKWDRLDDAFIARLKHLHQRITVSYLPLLHKVLNSRKAGERRFTKDFEKWTRGQGFDIERKRKELESSIAKQASYILLNQVLFYKILENEGSYAESITRLNHTSKPEELPRKLQEYFKKLVKNVDFKAVFEQDPIFNRIPIPCKIADELNEFIEEIESYDLTAFDSDIIGRIYEYLIPSTERHDLGQYYTPPQIVELIIELCVKNKNDTILDPACGSGGFLVKAYRKLKKLDSRKPHHAVLKQIYGIDINRFPAHLSAINLTIQDIKAKTDEVQIEVADFFDINIGKGTYARKTATIIGEETEEAVPIPNKVNVIVSNPPYIRQEKIADKDKVRKHLDKSKSEMSKRADIYAYFFTHAHDFLDEHGKIGYITSDKWLDTEYGEQLQKFFLKHFKIKAIIKFDKQAFQTPLIGSCITILEKSNSPKDRDENLTNLMRIKGQMDIEELVRVVEKTYEAETIHDMKTYRIVTKNQGILKTETKWNRYLYAPSLYFELLESHNLTTLEEICEISYGCKSGANEFFYLRRDDIHALGLDISLFSPIMKAIAQAESVNFKKGDTEWFVLDIHDLIEREVLWKSTGELVPHKHQTMAQLINEKLRQAGYKALYEYINIGEEKNYHKRPTCASRKIWFDLGELPRPQFIFPDVYWKKTSVPYNADTITIDKQLYTLCPKKGIDEMVLGGILNSDWIAFFREMHGRTIMGEGLNRNQMMVYEAKQLPVPDPRQFTMDESKRIRIAFENLLSKSRAGSEREFNQIRRELNKAVLATIGNEEHAQELEQTVKELIDIRIKGGGMQKEVMLEEEKPRVIKLKGAKVISSRSLDDFT